MSTNDDNYQELDKLGKLLMSQLRDIAIGELDGIFDRRHSFSPSNGDIRKIIQEAGVINEKKMFKIVVMHCVDRALSELLYNFSDVDELPTDGVVILEDGVDIREAEFSPQTQLFNRWIERFSKYGEYPLDEDSL